MRDYSIEELFGMAYETALKEVARVLKLTTGLELSYGTGWKALHNTAGCLNVRFDQNGFLAHIGK